ncbi:hypothetical protein J6590_034012 [Homalodisca vitripennis]|nr:hypothetical protein J6590_034012 [Homalodisca vitripennis]
MNQEISIGCSHHIKQGRVRRKGTGSISVQPPPPSNFSTPRPTRSTPQVGVNLRVQSSNKQPLSGNRRGRKPIDSEVLPYSGGGSHSLSGQQLAAIFMSEDHKVWALSCGHARARVGPK